MADFFCSFLDFRSHTTIYKLPFLFPSKHCCYSFALRSHNSRISRIKRRPLHLALLSKPSSSDLDVISTHEHSDGSILFRFGDPSEVAKNVKVEESKTVKEEIQGEGEKGSSVVKVVEGVNEREVTAKKADLEVIGSSLTEVADHSNSIVSSSKSITVVEGESESSEKLLEGSNDTELPVLNSSDEMGGVSTPDVDIEHIENVEEGLNEEYEDSSPVEASVLDGSAKTENNIATVELLERKTTDVTSTSKEIEVTSAPDVDVGQNGSVEEGLNEEYEDSSPVEASVVDETAKIGNNITTTALLEKETTDITSAPDINIEPLRNVEEGINEENEDSPVVATTLDKSSEVVSNITAVALSEKETADITSIPDIDIKHACKVEEGLDKEHEESSSANASILDKSPAVENNTTTLEFSEKETVVTSITEPVVAVPDNGVLQANLEIIVATEASPISEHQNVETEVQNETTEDGRESFDSNLVSPSEPATSFAKEIEEHNLQAEMQNVGIGKGSESDMNGTKALEMQNAIGNGNADQASGVGSGMPNETDGCVIEKDMIQSMTLPRRLEADSMLEEESGIETVEESRDDDGSENLKVGGDLVEASVDEATVTESTPMSQKMLTTNFVLSSGAALLPHPSKVLTGGEDAYFIVGQTWLGVADGAGQWSLKGTKPGIYAQELMKNCEKLISDCNGNSINNPVELLKLSVAETHTPGLSTVLIAQFDGQALHVANVGDSGFIVIRHGAIYKRSSPMHHVFHFPLQIERGDDPSSLAEFYRVELEEDDIIITATDGLLDNLYGQEISSIVAKSLAADKSLEEIAELLGAKAQEIGSSASVRSPFADEAQAAGFAGYSGGKLDDVAVIVSIVQRQ